MEEELKKKIANKIFMNQIGFLTSDNYFETPIPIHTLAYCRAMTDDIFNDIRDAGWHNCNECDATNVKQAGSGKIEGQPMN